MHCAKILLFFGCVILIGWFNYLAALIFILYYYVFVKLINKRGYSRHKSTQGSSVFDNGADSARNNHNCNENANGNANNNGNNGNNNEIALGIDSITTKPVTVSDRELNQHCLVVGTTGSGKTTTLMNIVASCCQRKLPLIYIDGKGNLNLAKQIKVLCDKYGRKFKLFSLDTIPEEELSRYNPFTCGNFTEWKNKIITLAQDAENKGQEHYSLQEQSYINLVCEILYMGKVYVDLEGIIAYLKHPEELQKLANRVSPELALRFAQTTNMVKETSDITNILELFYYSNYGKLFSTSKIAPQQLIDLYQALINGEVILFLLNSASYKRDTMMLGRLIINDINAVWAKCANTIGRTVGYCIFDEFAAYAAPNMADILAMQRDNGLHAVVGTQSINAIAAQSGMVKRVAVELIANCNTFIIHKLNDHNDIELLTQTIGTHKYLLSGYSYDLGEGSSLASTNSNSGFAKTNSGYNNITTRLNLNQHQDYLIDPQQIRKLVAGQGFLCRTVINATPQLVKFNRIVC
jgi:hypothetical protein